MIIKIIIIENKLFIIKSNKFILLVDRLKHTKYEIPKKANIFNLFSLISIVCMSSFDIENKMQKSEKVNNIYIINDYRYSSFIS